MVEAAMIIRLLERALDLFLGSREKAERKRLEVQARDKERETLSRRDATTHALVRLLVTLTEITVCGRLLCARVRNSLRELDGLGPGSSVNMDDIHGLVLDQRTRLCGALNQLRLMADYLCLLDIQAFQSIQTSLSGKIVIVTEYLDEEYSRGLFPFISANDLLWEGIDPECLPDAWRSGATGASSAKRVLDESGFPERLASDPMQIQSCQNRLHQLARALDVLDESIETLSKALKGAVSLDRVFASEHFIDSTIYLHADMAIKQAAIDRTRQGDAGAPAGRAKSWRPGAAQ